ncbi:MAG: nitrate reductase, partial [Alicyclobacillus sp. RIFOXYA1_FULL_53_8]
MKVKTACPLDCWDTCSIIAEVDNGRVTRLDGDPSHPVTQGFLCGKGRKLKDRLYSPSRVLQPLKKRDGTWQPIAWEQALDEIAEQIAQTVANSGHQAILHAYDWGSGTVLKNLNQRFFYQLGGCTETVGSLCWDAGLEAQRYDFGEARSHAPQDTAQAQAVVVWGRNVSNTNIHMVPFIKAAQANGARLVLINPLATDLDNRADLCLTPRPGSDAALAFGALKVCKDEGWLDTDFLSARSLGFAQLADYIDQFDLQTVAELTDVPAEQVVQLAEIYGQLRPVTTLLGIGLQRYPGGGNAIRAIDALAAATGQIGIAGGGVNYANRALVPYLDQEALAGRSGADVREFTRGDQAEQILAANPPIEVLFVTRTNPVTQVPNTQRLLQAYESIGCKVVIDMFLTPTAEVADYFLPCTSVLEEEDFVFSTMWQPYVTYITQAVEAQGEAKPDWEIFQALAERLGLAGFMDRTREQWLAAALEPLRAHGITLDTLRQEGTVRIPVSEIPWLDGRFLTPSGKFEFVSYAAEHEGHSGHAVYLASHETSRARGKTALPAHHAAHAGYPYALLTVHPRLSEN